MLNEKAAAYGPAEGRVFATLGRLYPAAGRRGDGLHAFQRAVDLRHYDRITLLTLAKLYRDDGELDKAVAVLETATSQFPETEIIRAYAEALAAIHKSNLPRSEP